MNMYQKREMRKNKKMNEDTKSLSSTSINWYPGHIAKTKREVKERIDLIDIVYEIIDARMPLSSKNNDINDLIKNKPRILIMTKKDLCDLNVTNKWIEYYKKQGYEVVPIYSNKNLLKIKLKGIFSIYLMQYIYKLIKRKIFEKKVEVENE